MNSSLCLAQNEWIDKFEVALKFNQMKKKKGQAPLVPSKSTSKLKLQLSTKDEKSLNRISLKSDSTLSPTSTISDVEIPNITYAPEWLLSAHEEIHTLIAQRHFEEALTLITKCEKYFAADSAFYNANEIIERVCSFLHPALFCQITIKSLLSF